MKPMPPVGCEFGCQGREERVVVLLCGEVWKWMGGMYRTCFGDGDCEVGEGDEAHWRSYYQRSLDPWVVMFEFLD